MRVYQRGSSTTTSNTFVVDRFKTDYLGGTLTTTRESLSSSDTPYTHGFRNSVKLTNTSAGSTAATDFRRLGQTIEAQDLANSGWNYTSATSFITLSFWVKSSLAGTYSADLMNDDGNQGYHFDFTLSANTWTKVTHSIKGGSGVVINNDAGSGMMVRVMPYLGTNYTTSSATAETWATYSSSYITGDYAQNWASTASATFEVTGVQLEVGDTATPFEYRSYAEELALCQRYYYRLVSGGEGSNYRFGTGAAISTTQMDTHFQFQPQMRATPSLDAMTAGNYRTNYDQDATSIFIVHATPTGTCVRTTHGSTQAQGFALFLNPSDFSGHTNTDAAYLAFDAEL
jgi:hypothetical protein